MAGGKDILEVASGPGYLSIELAKEPTFNVTALDVSETFVQIASQKAKENHVAVKFVVGNASEMPFKDGQFDFIVCRAAFKNFSQPLDAINEMYRVLRPVGKALIVDLRKDISDQEIASYVKKMNLGKWDSLFTSMGLKNLRKRAHSNEELERMSRDSRFRKYQINKSLNSVELSLEK